MIFGPNTLGREECRVGVLFFQGADTAHGVEPWFTDGTVAGTRLIADLQPGTSGSYSYPDGTIVAGDWVYFPADGPGGTRPWRTDGTTAGTQRLTELPDAKSPQSFTRVGNDVFFAACLHDGAFALWRSSLASGETVLVKQFERRVPYAMWDLGGTLLFTLRGGQLWRSDGTAAGTTLVRDSLRVPDCFERLDFAVGNGLLFWYAYDDFVPELWRTDGTPAGTFRLGSFPGPYAESLQQCLPHYLHFAGGRLFFIGNDDIHGAEPWTSDGTIAGTQLWYDINPGPAPSNPAVFFTLGRTLYFDATDVASGQELWSACLSDCSARHRAVRK